MSQWPHNLTGTCNAPAGSDVLHIMLHIGKIIEKEMHRQERTPAWLARKINCQRTNIYYIFSQPSIHTDVLARISKALDHDFFRDLSDDFQSRDDQAG